MTTPNTYPKGTLVRVSGTFQDDEGTAYDPGGSVLAGYLSPAGSLTTLTYGEDAELVRDSEGTYHVDIDGSEGGDWYYSIYATGSGQAANEGRFHIEAARTF